MKLKWQMVVVVSALCVAACSSTESSNSTGSVKSTGNAFCDDYGTKLLALKCSSVNADAASAFASICKQVLDTETTCATQYKANLTCQGTTSKCVADGKLEFGACETQGQAYSDCKNGGTTTEITCAQLCGKDTSPTTCSKDADCATQCAETAKFTSCKTQQQAYFACVMEATTFECDAEGNKGATGCTSQEDAYAACADSSSDAGM